MVVLHAAIAIAAAIALILVVRVDPVLALVVGSVHLGAGSWAGLREDHHDDRCGLRRHHGRSGPAHRIRLLLASLLRELGALRQVVEKLLRALGAHKLPYALAGALSTVFPVIYVDVQLVLAAPLARSAASHLGRNGLAMRAAR